MRKSRFSTEQIAQILAHAESGVPPKELCRKYGVSEATFYVWRRKNGGLAPSEVRRLKQLEEENRKLKKLLAESMLDASTLKEMLAKNF